jgi:hypothetical protein
MTNATGPPRKRYTAIVRRGKTEAFARLTRAVDQVLWDRRVAERRAGRRHATSPPSGASTSDTAARRGRSPRSTSMHERSSRALEHALG